VRTADRRLADAEAFEWFFRAQFPSVVRSLSHLLRRQDAEDVAQEAFAKLHQHWAKVSRYEQPDAWVRRVAINRAISLATRESHRHGKEHSARWQAAEEVAAPLGTLSPRDRALVVLFYYEDRPLAEAADVLGMSAGSAKVALHRARQRIAALLHEEGAHDTR
jgi:DNA-directed RNA polymerase specialized sigma24 family protein